MTPCLSDRALTRVAADLGTPGECAHLAACPACAARSRRLDGQIDAIVRVLTTTREPAPRPAPVARRWVAAGVTACLVAMAAAGISTRHETRPRPERGPQIALGLADITAVLLSVDGEPVSAAAFVRDGVPDAACEGRSRDDDIDCADPLGPDERIDWLRLDATDAPASEHHDEGV